jgi:hypothetical protein
LLLRRGIPHGEFFQEKTCEPRCRRGFFQPCREVFRVSGHLTTTFALAIDLVLADGRIGPREKTFIDELQAVLGIDDTLALKIVEVALIGNRPAESPAVQPSHSPCSSAGTATAGESLARRMLHDVQSG